ncbi:hypothetical protein ACR4XJ_01935 [Nitratidesulfovibrio sp. D1]|uniref:hypothetical protein n=1 Tax=Nitratidesulfovibrio sp. D1 TaxID=3440151 RepID=UPI003EBE9FBF
MKIVKPPARRCADLEARLQALSDDVTEQEDALFRSLVVTELAPWQEEQVTTPPAVHEAQREVLATHWHPEFVPMGLIRRRIETMFPGREEELIIPTQHNELTSWDGYTGVEVDCYSSGFNQKVQLLLHFESRRVADGTPGDAPTGGCADAPAPLPGDRAHTLRSMLAHTRRYRASQLYDYVRAVVRPDDDAAGHAVRETGADDDVLAFARTMTGKFSRLLETHGADLPKDMVKNKLLRNFIDGLRGHWEDTFIDRVQAYLKAVKEQVKRRFPLGYFYRATEFIEEAHGLGGCVVIPHPEQFWPILLAEYDVDGYEVWNPQSSRYTEFLISVANRKNRGPGLSRREILVFMGDDCHLGEKTRPRDRQDTEKAAREVGLQPAWDDPAVRKRLSLTGVSRASVIRDYRARLAG